MIERLKQYLYRINLKFRGATLKYNVRGRDFLFGNVKGFKNGAYIMFENGVKLNISGSNAILSIVEYSYINSYTIIDCHYKISIGSRAQIGPNCYIGDFDHDLNVDINQHFHRPKNSVAEVNIGDNVWLGAGVIVLKGVTIGKNSVIAAGAVVIDNIPANMLAAGVPAKVIKEIKGNIDQA